MPLPAITLQLPARIDALEAASQFVLNAAHAAQLPQDRLAHLELIVEELFVNIALYAYPPESPGPVQLTCASPASGQLNVQLTDQGIPYNPLLAPAPDLESPIHNRSSGGLGIFIIREWTNSIQYLRDKDTNRLSFTISAN